MTPEKWMSLYDATKDKFMWFVLENFIGMDVRFNNARNENNWVKLIDLMNSVWFALPDGRFNIIENPPGWSEFVNLLECEIKE